MKCIHHNDKDGRGAAFMVFINERVMDALVPENFIEMDYSMEIPYDKIEKDELVYIVDMSFKENTAYRLDKLLEITKNIVWIDHHRSSFDLLSKRPDLDEIKGLRMEGISGMALAAMYFNNCTYHELPAYIKYISDYDCWLYKYGQVTENFNYAMDSYEQAPYSLNSIWLKLWDENRNGSRNTLDELIKEGKAISKYIKTKNKDILDLCGFETDIFEGYTCKVVNKKDNSIAFGDEIRDYDLVCCYHYNGQVYKYSIYTTSNDIRCDKIAAQYGGGGHPQASGFNLPYNLFDGSVE